MDNNCKIFIPASRLCKLSAYGLYLERHKAPPLPTARMVAGNAFADSSAKSKAQELSGILSLRDVKIAFSIDEVFERKGWVYTVEHKMVTSFPSGATLASYFNKSVVQAALYHSLALYAPVLRTAKWYMGEVFEIKSFKSLSNTSCLLNFGGTYYQITVDPVPLIRYFATKARASLVVSRAVKFDRHYKEKKDEYFSRYITVRKWRQDVSEAHTPRVSIAKPLARYQV